MKQRISVAFRAVGVRGDRTGASSDLRRRLVSFGGLTMDLFQVLKRIDGGWAAYDGRGTSHIFTTDRAAREFASRRASLQCARRETAPTRSVERRG